MSKEALRQQVIDLYRGISDCKISAENFENHPSITSQIIAKNPVANLRIPAKLFVLWSDLKSIQVPTPTYVDLVRYSLKDNSGFVSKNCHTFRGHLKTLIVHTECIIRVKYKQR